MRSPIAAALLVLIISGCGSTAPQATPTASSTPKTFRVTGTIRADAYIPVTIESPDVKPQDGEVGCTTKRGYDDIAAGAQVNVRSASGEVLAVGNLAVGLYRQNETYDFISDCEFPFTVAGVPDDRDLYLVEVSHRGELTYPRDKLNEPVNLTLG